jgi:hypothetical protein
MNKNQRRKRKRRKRRRKQRKMQGAPISRSVERSAPSKFSQLTPLPSCPGRRSGKTDQHVKKRTTTTTTMGLRLLPMAESQWRCRLPHTPR